MEQDFLIILVLAGLSFILSVCLLVLGRKLTSSKVERSHLQALVDSIPDLTWVKDKQLRFLMVNKKFSEKFHCSIEEILGQKDDFLSPSKDALSYQKEDQWVMDNNKILRKEEPNIDENGNETWAEIIKVPVIGANNTVIGTAGIARDITLQKNSQKYIHYLAHHDVLTRLPNRLQLEEWVKLQIETIASQQQIQFFFIDLDNFKIINDTIGHIVGDYILIELAKRLLQFASGRGLASRIGGDEFVICLNNCDKSEVKTLGGELKKMIAEPILYQELEFEVTMSIGVATFPDDGDECWSLVKNADIAMYHAKHSGKNRIVSYTFQLAESSINRMTIETRIKNALLNDEFSIVYQPKVNLNSLKLIGFEALLRWQDNTTKKYCPPSEFIPIAESSSLILKIGNWVLEAVLKQIILWKDLANLKPIAINISAQQIHQKSFADQILTQLDNYQIAGELLELELTENVTMENSDLVMENLRKLRNAGIKISIDDFGTGYSNLAYLSKFPLDTLKIDRSFIHQIDLLPNKMKITRAIIEMARSLQLNIIAEGVETAQELQVMQYLRVDQIQGYYFDKPLSAQQAELKMRSNITYKICY